MNKLLKKVATIKHSESVRYFKMNSRYYEIHGDDIYSIRPGKDELEEIYGKLDRIYKKTLGEMEIGNKEDIKKLISEYFT